MFMVFDHSLTVEPDDRERGFISPDAIIDLDAAEAARTLAKSVRFSLAYEANPDPEQMGDEPPLSAENAEQIETWLAAPSATLRITTRDYAHIILPLSSEPAS